MANFSVANSSALIAAATQAAMTTSYKSLIVVAASSGGIANPPTNIGLSRGKLYDLLIGTDGTPADNYMEFDVARATVGTTVTTLAGTCSSISAQFMLDSADAGFSAYVAVNSSVETSVTSSAEAFYVGINQRASYRWVAAPGSEIVYPAVSSASATPNGLLLRARSAAYTGTATGNVLVQEQ
jgi:hypothetical protein